MLPLLCWCMIFTTGRRPARRGHVAMFWYASSFYCVLSGQCGLGQKLDAGWEGYLGTVPLPSWCWLWEVLQKRVRSQCWWKVSLPGSSAWCARPPVFGLHVLPRTLRIAGNRCAAGLVCVPTQRVCSSLLCPEHLLHPLSWIWYTALLERFQASFTRHMPRSVSSGNWYLVALRFR